MTDTAYDIVVIGAGSAGLTMAVGLAKAGKKVLLVEREHMGGECTNTGCIPSKALLHHARSYYQSQSIAGSTPASEAYRHHAFTHVRDKITEVLKEETPAHFESLGITVLLGDTAFTSPTTLTVSNQSYAFKKVVIATGSSPRPLTIPGLDEAQLLTNQNLFALDTIPTRTLVIGAGPIGLEMGQALAMLGSQVTIATIDSEFASLEDTAIQPIITRACTDLGIHIERSAFITSVAHNEALFERKINDVVTDTFHVPFDAVLLAIGRIPNLPSGLTAANIQYDQNGIGVNKNFRTTNPRVYAIGDVAAALKFTHTADDAARRLIPHLVSHGVLPVQKERAVPKVTYTSPEMAQVGRKWNDAVATYGADRLHRLEVPLAHNDRAKTEDVTEGMLVVIATRLTGRIIGVHYVGPRAGELIACFTLAMDNNLSLWKLRRTIYAYPTYALLIKKVGDVFLARQISTGRTDLWRVIKSLAPKVLTAVIWITGVFLLYRYLQSHDLTIPELALQLFVLITETRWGPLLYILAYAVRPLTFFPGTAMTILSGVFFGLWGGIIYTIIGANLSASLAYAVGRYYSNAQPRTDSLIKKMQVLLQGSPFMSVLIARLTFMPYDGVNYGAGFLKVPFIPYLAATIVGTLLGITTFVAIGASVTIEEVALNELPVPVIDSWYILVSLGIFLLSLLLSTTLKRYTKTP